MIDELMCRRSARRFVPDDQDYNPSNIVMTHELINQSTDRLAVIFPPWNGGGRAINLLAERVVRRGYTVLKLASHPRILEPNVNNVLTAYRLIRDQTADLIDHTIDQSRYDKPWFIGPSLGNVALTMTASIFPDFAKASMAVAGSNLATCLWRGIRTQPIAKELLSQGVDMMQLEEAWNELAPINNLKTFQGKPVDMLISTTDRVIPTQYQRAMHEGLVEAGANVTVRETALGHYAATGLFCLTA